MADMTIKSILFLCGVFLLWGGCLSVLASEECYIITARDGSVRIVRDYKFTEQHVEFTQEDGSFGFIDRNDFVKIENMQGVPQAEPPLTTELLTEVEHKAENCFFPGVIGILIFFVVLTFRRRRKKKSTQELTVNTLGHLTFTYRDSFWRKSKWTIDVQRGFKERNILYFEGYCTKTDKRKIFRADRVIGPVTDMSNERRAPIESFFVTPASE